MFKSVSANPLKTRGYILLFVIFYASSAFAQNENSGRQKNFNLNEGVAISGYDPVAYFDMGKAVKGEKSFSYIYNGITYRFSSQQDLEKFKKSPAQYEPQYGGWCAYAMGAKGQKVEVDPGTFKIVNGKLYLFYNKYFNNTLNSWNKDEQNLRTKADSNWAGLIKQ